MIGKPAKVDLGIFTERMQHRAGTERQGSVGASFGVQYSLVYHLSDPPKLLISYILIPL